MFKVTVLKITVLLSLLLGMSACSVQNEIKQSEKQNTVEPQALISGEITYRERIKLPDNAKLTVSLIDNEKNVIAEMTTEALSSPPWPYTLTVAPSVIQPEKDYQLISQVDVLGTSKFMTITPLAALNINTEPKKVNIVLRAAPVATLFEQIWQLIEINAEPVKNTANNPPTLLFDKKAQRVAGFAGCNRFSGGYTHSGNQLGFGLLMSTQMACNDPDNTEINYLQTLAKVISYKVLANELQLLDQHNSVILRFNKHKHPQE